MSKLTSLPVYDLLVMISFLPSGFSSFALPMLNFTHISAFWAPTIDMDFHLWLQLVPRLIPLLPVFLTLACFVTTTSPFRLDLSFDLDYLASDLGWSCILDAIQTR
ncbi:hypothetical protein ILYODFUR_029471 [Ilyodon furcidens]|uniref:NADH dehydrogenase subunit 5 n=1 Tax=Ilyodon furcidens TaxID=33524 RepID=A0ABV0U2Y6_9TELE